MKVQLKNIVQKCKMVSNELIDGYFERVRYSEFLTGTEH